jgi:hypothetical protein
LSDGVFNQLPAALGAHNDAGTNLTQLDHVGHLNHAVENPQTGVGDVVNHRALGQFHAVMHAARGRWLQKVPAHRTVNQGAKLATVDSARGDGLVSRLDADRARPRIGRKKPPLANARHQFEPPLGKAQPLVQWCQAPLELGRRDDLLRQGVAERFEADATIVHGWMWGD